MKNFNALIERLNFKKIIAIYIALAVITGLLSVGFLSYMFKDKLIFAYNLNNLSERIEKGKLGIDSVKSDIISLARQSSDIVDILILDKDNRVLFSAKQSEFGNGEFKLENERGERGGYLTYFKNPDVSFRLMDNDDLILNAVFTGHEKEISHHHKDENFFRNNFMSKRIYLLSYAVNRNSGDKIYFISDINKIPEGEVYLDMAGSVGMTFVVLYWILLVLWVYQDAMKSKIDAVLWGSIALFTNLAGLFVYLIYKQSNKVCYKCNTIQNRNNIFCRYCGTKIGNACKSCSNIVNEEDKFCSSCGNKISA